VFNSAAGVVACIQDQRGVGLSTQRYMLTTFE